MTAARSFCFVCKRRRDARIQRNMGVELKFWQLTFNAHKSQVWSRIIYWIHWDDCQKKHRLCLPVNVCVATLRFILLFVKHLCWFNSSIEKMWFVREVSVGNFFFFFSLLFHSRLNGIIEVFPYEHCSDVYSKKKKKKKKTKDGQHSVLSETLIWSTNKRAEKMRTKALWS